MAFLCQRRADIRFFLKEHRDSAKEREKYDSVPNQFIPSLLHQSGWHIWDYCIEKIALLKNKVNFLV